MGEARVYRVEVTGNFGKATPSEAPRAESSGGVLGEEAVSPARFGAQPGLLSSFSIFWWLLL